MPHAYWRQKCPLKNTINLTLEWEMVVDLRLPITLLKLLRYFTIAIITIRFVQFLCEPIKCVLRMTNRIRVTEQKARLHCQNFL